MRKMLLIFIFFLSRIVCYGQAAIEFPEKRINDFLGMLGNNYIDLLEEQLAGFVDDTETPITVQVSYEGNIYEKSSTDYNRAWQAHHGEWVRMLVRIDPESYAYKNASIHASGNLRSKLPIDTCDNIIDQVMARAFTKSDIITNNHYYDGLRGGIKAIKHAIKPDYKLPFTAYVEDEYFLVDPESKNFVDGDTIKVFDYMEGLTLFIKDANDQEIVLAPDNFPDLEVKSWVPGATVDIEDFENNSVIKFGIMLAGFDTIQLSLQKNALESNGMTEGELEAFKTASDTAKEYSDSWAGQGYACNIGVRTFLYFNKYDKVLFPMEGSGLFSADQHPYFKGDVTNPGRANNIYNDLYKRDLEKFFSISAKEERDYPDFDNIQYEANHGEVIVGVKKVTGGNGHIVVIMPEEMNEQSSVERKKLINGEEINLPISLECGSGNKEIVPFKNYDDIMDYQWYKY